MFRRTGVIGLIILAFATISSGCTPQATEASGGGGTEGNTLGSFTPQVTKASGGGTDGNTAGSVMPSGATEEVSDWWGVIKNTEPGAQFDDYFQRQDLGQVIYFGIDSMDPAVQSQIEALRDSGRIVHLYGTLLSNVPDYNGSQIQVDRLEVEK